MSRRNASFGQLIGYILQYKGVEECKEESFVIAQNLRGRIPKTWVNEFLYNERNRLHLRSSTVKMYHTTLSFHPEDSKHITKQILKDITRKFIQLNNEGALTMASAHFNKKNVHVHIMQSGIDKFSGKSIRVSKERFKWLKMKMERHCIEKYPQLNKSKIDHDRKSKVRISEQEFQLTKRTKKVSDREEAQKIILKLFESATSRYDYFQSVRDKGYEIYFRNGNEYGIKGKRKMRFSTLGITEKDFQKLDLLSEFEQVHIKNKIERMKEIRR